MNNKQLTYFIEVVKQKSFTKAAERLYLCQSALSKTIKLMENELGVQLIDRTSRSFKLTPEGTIFYENGQKTLKNINDEMQRLCDSINVARGTISVGIPPVIGASYFTKIIYDFKKQYPDITLKVLEVGANTVKDKVDEGEIDIGVVILPFHSDGFHVTPVIKNTNVLIVNKNHPLLSDAVCIDGKMTVPFIKLRNEKFISLNNTYMLYYRTIEMCRKAGFEPNIVYESTQWDFVADMVALNQGIAVLPKPILKKFKSEDIRLLELTEPEFPWNIAVIIKKDKYISNAINNFIQLVAERGKEMSQ